MASDFECDTNHAKHGKKEKNIKMIVEGEKESSMEGRKEIVYKSLIADKENLPSFDELLVDSALVLPTRRRKSNLIKTAGIDTFCSKQVKSSGYGMKGPRMMQGTGPLATAKRERQNKIKKKKLLKDRQQRKRNMLYPIEGNIIDSHQSQHDDNASQCLFPPVASMSFDSLGEFLATAHKDNSLHILRLPFSKYGAASKQVSTSHPYAICETTGAAPFYVPRPSWSYCRRYIALQNKILSLSEGFKSLSISMDLGADSTNGCFYYKDLFTIYSQGSRVFMQRSDISEKDHTNEKTNKIKYSNDTTVNHKRRHEVIFHSGKRSWQRITSIAANNELETNIIGTACSDKSLRIIDAARGEELWSKGNAAGARPAHFIAFPPASSNIPISPDSFNLLLAASTDNGGLCSLWDLRTGKSVRCFSSHVNRTERCFGSFSPCMRYIGIGSEGNSANAFLYDMRATGKVIKIGRSSEHSRFCDNTITDIQFNPLWPQLVTGSLSGRLRWYNAT
jgi:WD40 repeat protein